jgi:preprotein translocase subunit SecG
MGLFILFTVLILISAVLIILVVLVQNSKGGGLAANFAGQNQYMGVRKTADFLEKFTWTLAILMLVFVLASSKAIPKHQPTHAAQPIQSEVNIDQIPVRPTETFDPSEFESNKCRLKNQRSDDEMDLS